MNNQNENLNNNQSPQNNNSNNFLLQPDLSAITQNDTSTQNNISQVSNNVYQNNSNLNVTPPQTEVNNTTQTLQNNNINTNNSSLLQPDLSTVTQNQIPNTNETNNNFINSQLISSDNINQNNSNFNATPPSLEINNTPEMPQVNSINENNNFINSQQMPNNNNDQNNSNFIQSPQFNNNINTNNMNQQSYQINNNIQPNTPNKNKTKTPLIIGVIGLVIVAIVIISSVVGNKTLTCTREENVYGIKMSGETKINFKLNRAQSADMKITFDLGKHADLKDELITPLVSEYKKLEQKGVKVNITSDASKIYIEASIKKNNIIESGIGSSDTYDDAKKELEADGYKCK